MSTLHLIITVWTFAAADIRTMVLPLLLLGILSASAGSVLTTSTIFLLNIVRNIPTMFLWIWLNVLVLSISNQSSPNGIVEDKINKPWRPIPSGRVDLLQARKLLLWSVSILLLIGHRFGVLYETLGCLVGNWVYNDLEGGSEHFLLRQVLNGVAYLPYGIGSMKLAVAVVHGNIEPNTMFYQWITIISAIVATTIQIQDLKDLEGDRARHRHTCAVIVGDKVTRISCGLGVISWSILCPVYWGLQWHNCPLTLVLGSAVILNISFQRGQKADKTSFVLWSYWVVSLFSLPLIKSWQHSDW